MCRSIPEEDLVVELLHYDPENYRLEHTIADGVAVVETVESLTHDITRLVLRADGFEFTPGQYVDLHVDGERRSFSMADIEGGQIELIIKRYPGGRFSGKLDGELKPGDEIGYTGPYGSLRARGLGPADPDDCRRLWDGADPLVAARVQTTRVHAADPLLLWRAHRGRSVLHRHRRRARRVHAGHGTVRA